MLGWDLIVEQWDEENKMFSIGCVMPIIQHHKGGGGGGFWALVNVHVPNFNL